MSVSHPLPDGSSVELVEVPGGRFRMGCADFYPEETPVHEREVRDRGRRLANP